LPASPFANPFKIGRDGTREEVIAKYRAWLLARPDLVAYLPELGGKVLGCWCKQLVVDVPYHGDVLAELAHELEGDDAVSRMPGDGERKTITIGKTVVTDMPGDQFHDADGRYHHHDPNPRTTEYGCSEGHGWAVSRVVPCPVQGCTFGREGEWGE
jgi:hypothetical protein